ncbi:polysaccharide biosynthesis protein [Candidatus Dependentiae bacterium]|nr:polysaccharide biosynthesis protein [Candidatus Dependentiae bacterium]
MSLSKKIVKGLSWDFIGITTINIIAILTSIVFVRILNSEIYGVFVILLNFYQLLVLFTSFGLDTTLLKYYSEWKTSEQYNTIVKVINFIVKFRAVITLILGIIFLTSTGMITDFIIKKPIEPLLIKLIGIFFIVSSFQGIFQQILIAEFEQKYINTILVTFFLLRFIAGVIQITFFNGGIKELILIYILAQAGLVICMFIRMLHYYKLNKFKSDISKVTKEIDAKKISSFAFFAYLIIVLGYVFGKGMDIFLIGKLLEDTREVTYYALAHGFSYMIISFSSRAFSGGIPLSVVAKLYTDKDFNGLRTFFTGFFEALYFFIIPMAAGAWMLRFEIVNFLYGEGFEKVGAIIGIFLITMIFLKFSSITSTFIIAMGWEKKLVVSRLILGGVNFTLDILFIPKWGALGAVLASTIAGLSAGIYETILFFILLKPKFPFKFIFKTILATSIMCGAVYLITTFWLDSFNKINIFIIALIGSIIYFSLTYVLKPLSKEYLDIIKSRKMKIGKILKHLTKM